MYMGVGSYDAVYVYKQAAESAGTVRTGDIDNISDALEKTDYMGASGRIQFTSGDTDYAHDVKYGKDKQPMIARQWQKAENGNGLAGSGGKKVAVWPKEYATGKHQAPPWV
ncbi:ABC transporter substrate-binding protein [Halarchaeum acidiphilum MH1-52-1]|uniref:ABC transporter substrate-binding protein n=2 Tax=Halarchaeum acidiphilum TaxID=489138 RepID=U2YYF5_9EURY|nr:ABC transporter substrate-binding protein [Halarchaeum acidiphilum MH1-52-1]